MQLRLLLLLLLLPGAFARGQDDEVEAKKDAILLVEATWVDCSDTTEALLIYSDGRAIYAQGGTGIAYPVSGATLADLKKITDGSESLVERKRLDSCSTLGVILNGPRYLLINSRRPGPATRELHGALEQIRKYARRKLASIERLRSKAAVEPDTTIDSDPTVEQDALLERIDPSPIAREWRCRGSVSVAVMVDRAGRVRQAFVENADVRGKCASLLTVTAIAACTQTTFSPAVKRNGRKTSGWMRIDVAFGTGSLRSQGN